MRCKKGFSVVMVAIMLLSVFVIAMPAMASKNVREINTEDDANTGKITEKPIDRTILNLGKTTITIDGDPSDWIGISPIVTDPSMDSVSGYSDDDIQEVYITHDSTNLYLRMDLRSTASEAITWIYFDMDTDQNINTGYNTNTDVNGEYLNGHDTGIDYCIEVITYNSAEAVLFSRDSVGNWSNISLCALGLGSVVEVGIPLSSIGETSNPSINLDFQTFFDYGAEDEAPDTGCVTYGTPGENHPPYKPSSPNPSDGATNVPTNTLLSWSGGDPDGDTMNYDVYLGTAIDPPLVSSVSATSYSPLLNPNTKYYWKINATDSHGAFNISDLWEFTTGTGAVGANWTFMVYLDGDNDLEGAAIDDMNELEVVGSTSNVNILVQLDRISGYDASNGDWESTRRYYVTQDADQFTINSNLIQDLGEVNMANPDALVNFIEWAMQNYPAEHYALILWNHGSGWKYPKNGNNLFKGVISDDTSGGDDLSLQELQQVLKTIKTDTGKTMDIIGFDACLMQMVEVAYQIEDYADVMVGSEDMSPWDGLPYNTILFNLTANSSMTPNELGSEIVVDFMASYGTSGHETQSAANLTKLSNLASVVDNFAQILNNSLPSYSDEILAARMQSEAYFDYEFIDLYHFSELINLSISDIVVQTAATAVMNNIADTIFAEGHGVLHQNSHGFTVYFPLTRGTYLKSYDNIDFTKDTKWDEFLKEYYIHCAKSSLVPGANILLVDDDEGNLYERFYKDALTTNGYAHSYWNIANDGSLNTTILSNHSIVIWFTGDDYFTTLESTDLTILQTYLNAGGNLFISGQDIGYDLVENGNETSQAFYNNYLHAQYVADNSGITTLNGVSGDPIGYGLAIKISGGDGAKNQNYPSNINAYDIYASAVFNYTGDGCGAIKANTTTYKVVYFAFGFEGINNSTDRNTVMNRIITWLGVVSPTAVFDTGSPVNPYPSISGTHNGTITPSLNLTISKLYTYSSPGTGGHTEYVKIWNSTTGWNITATWNGYNGDWHNLTFSNSFILYANETYNYTIRTGSYPQIHHNKTLRTENGWINCTEFVDVNGKRHEGWIPAIRLS